MKIKQIGIGELLAHVGDAANPHGVTAAQAGALAIANRLSEIAAASAATPSALTNAQLAAIENMGLQGFRKVNDESIEFLARAYFDGVAWRHFDGSGAMRVVQTGSVFAISVSTTVNPSPDALVTSWETVANINSGGVYLYNRRIIDVGNGGISFAGTGAKDTTANLRYDKVDVVTIAAQASLVQVAPASWNGKYVIVNLHADTTSVQFNFDSATWVDGMHCIVVVKANPSNTKIVYRYGTAAGSYEDGAMNSNSQDFTSGDAGFKDGQRTKSVGVSIQNNTMFLNGKNVA